MTIWGLRLALHIGWRNHGKGEDYRYQQFRQDFGPERYWWFSYFQVFLLQGGLLWFISAPLLAVPYLAAEENPFGQKGKRKSKFNRSLRRSRLWKPRL